MNLEPTPATPTAASPARLRLLQVVVFVAGAVLMALEILGSRVLAPSFGSSVYVWGSLISTFLVALAVGYAAGGRIADRHPTLSTLSTILAIAAVLMLPCVVWADAILRVINGLGWDARLGALAAAIVLFLPPSLAMGMVTPFAVRIGIRAMESAGRVSGGYSALSTAGSIVGTLAATFILIPYVGVPALLLALGAVLVLCSFVLARKPATLGIGLVAAAALAVGFVSRTAPAGGERILESRDTAYHHILVTQLDNTRWMRFDNLSQTAVDVVHPDRSVLGYDQGLMLAFALRPGIRRICLIGLGGGVLPRAAEKIHPDIEIDSVEIDPFVREAALRHFLYRESDRVRTHIEDGRVFISRPGPPYDLMVLDAFNSTGTPFHLTTREFFEAVRRRLTPDGVFAANFVGKLMGRDSRLFWATYRTIRRQFGQVYVVSAELRRGERAMRNNIIVLATVSADPIAPDVLRQNIEQLAAQSPGVRVFIDDVVHSPDPPADVPELTDAYSPVEALQHF